MMYPLYLLGLIALVIAIQRLITSRQGRLAPKPLCKSVNECLANGDLKEHWLLVTSILLR
mgnify:CR=1 FL=1